MRRYGSQALRAVTVAIFNIQHNIDTYFPMNKGSLLTGAQVEQRGGSGYAMCFRELHICCPVPECEDHGPQ